MKNRNDNKIFTCIQKIVIIKTFTIVLYQRDENNWCNKEFNYIIKKNKKKKINKSY